MKTSIRDFLSRRPGPSPVAWAVASLIAGAGWLAAADLSLRADRTSAGLELTWPAARSRPDGSTSRPYFEVQHSRDLVTWNPAGERIRMPDADSPDAGGRLRFRVEDPEAHGFFRVLAIEPTGEARLAADGAEAFGYGTAFARELARVGQLRPAEFAARHDPGLEYLPGIDWDPTSGAYWDLFAMSPEVFNRDLIWGVDDVRLTDFRLDAQELATFRKLGFVVSERLGSYSFADLFYKLWKDDLPVFVSTDAVLQAWHRTYDMMLEELEETFLFESLDRFLSGMAAQLPAAWEAQGAGFLAESLLDADYFLAVARALLAEEGTPIASVLGQNDRVAETLRAVSGEQLREFDLFGACRTVDYSQFKVRGHYEHSDRLARYFRCVTWLGRIDLRVAGGPFQDCSGTEPRMASPREMAAAIVLWHLLTHAGEFDTWHHFDRTIQTFVGWTDSMTFAQLGQLLAASGVRSLADIRGLAAVERIQAAILAGDVGAQNIRSDYFYSPLGPGQVVLPRSFTVLGQKFTPDSWALKKVVYDDIRWTENGVTTEVCRRLPGALDVAFSVLGNDQVVPEIVARILDPGAASSSDSVIRARDGQPYQHHLAAVRVVIEAQAPSAWEESIYLGWLDTLRQLSAPTTDARHPQAMRTRAWAMKTLNTQLASWTHLRHDTILYAKQSYTSGGECSYPVGYVEPRPEFWRRLGRLALRAHDLIAGLDYRGTLTFPLTEYVDGGRIQVGEKTVPLAEVQAHQLEHLRSFARAAATLEGISRKELAQECLDPVEVDFLRNLIEDQGWLPFGGSAAVRTYSGWYPRLFYRKVSEPDDAIFHANRGADAEDAVVADVHTDVPSPDSCGSPGHVLHEGVGRVNLLMLAVENGGDRMVVAGPVLSHYEFSLPGPPRRLSDNEWNWEFARKAQPNPWTRDYFVPQDRR